MFRRFAFGFGYLAILLAAGLLVLGIYFKSGTVPEYSGTAAVSGIGGTVDIDRDAYAIPHIHAVTERDAYFGLGYAEAQDRLFQMEIARRLGAGRMSEIFGNRSLPLDEWSRTVGFARIADQMWLKAGPHTREVVTAFVAGINAYLAEHRKHLGFEFDALALVPENWRPQDCLAIGRLMSWEMNFSALSDAAFGDFSLALDSAHLRSLFPVYPDDGATVLGGANSNTFVSNYLATGQIETMAHRASAATNSVATPSPAATPVPSTTPVTPKLSPPAKQPSPKPSAKAKPSQPSTNPPPFKPPVKPPKPRVPKPLPLIGERGHAGSEFGSLFRSASAFDSAIGACMGGGSNAFAVSGSRTADSAAMLENDTHLQLGSPSRWYLAHLITDDGMNVAGFLIPGMPVILAGRTAELSWGITNGMADECDYFIERLDSTGTEYLLPNGARQNFTVIHDTIRVRDSTRSNPVQTFPLTVRMTVHGPVLSGMHPDAMERRFYDDPRAGGVPNTSIFSRDSKPLSMMWNGTYALSDELAGFLALPRAKSVAEARRGMAGFATPCLNLCLADTRGNISYQYIGRLPRRSGSEERQLLPRDGTNPADQWTGFVSMSELPSVTNPARGYIVSANNPPMKDRPIPFSMNWEPSSRADRIGELLAERPHVDNAYIQSIQTDVLSPYDLHRVMPYLLALYPDPHPPRLTPDSTSAFRLDSMRLRWKEDSLVRQTSLSDSLVKLVREKDSAWLTEHRTRNDTLKTANVDPFTAQVLEYLRNWDGGMRTEEIAPAIYSVFLNRLLYNTFFDGLSSDDRRIADDASSNARYSEFIFLQNIPLQTLAHILPDTANVWWHNGYGKHGGRDSVVQRSFRESLRILAQMFGPDIRQWQWGMLHTLTFRHFFDKESPLLARLVDVKAGPMPGGPTTILQGSYYLWNPYEMQIGPSMRMIADMKNDVLLAVLPTGNSEAIFGDHYRDMLPLYKSGALVRIELNAIFDANNGWKRFELRPE